MSHNPSSNQLKILIIEDEKLILKSMEFSLKRRGHLITTTTLGKQGLNYLLERNFDLIITDLMLNDISGFDILEGSLKKMTREEIKNKFIIMTAYSSEQIILRAQEYGCLFLRKPFESLNNAIEQILQKVKV